MNHLLLNKFFTNECNTFERKIVIDWMLDPANDFLLKKWMRENWDKLSDYDTENELDIDKTWTKIHASLQLEVNEPAKVYPVNANTKFYGYRKMIFRVASIVAIFAMLFLGIFWMQKQTALPFFTAKDTQAETLTNKEGTAKTIILEDGTKVVLGVNASIAYPVSFLADRRELTLVEGEVFFEVAKDAERPFLVYTKNIVTKVLGTSFTVQSNKASNDITVSVVTGKVQVFEKNEKNSNAVNSKTLSNSGVLLTPNQKTTYTASKQNFETSIVEKPVPINSTELPKNYFDFNRAYLPDLINRLQKVYGIEIILENDNFNSCIFSGDISEENLYEKLDLVCKSIGATYEISGTRILIEGKGCK